MRLLAFDCETQGFVPSKECRITEIGAILFEWSTTGVKIIGELNRYIWEPGFPPQPKEIVELTGITDQMLLDAGIPFQDAVSDLHGCIGPDGFDYFIAHNKSFDEKFWNSEMALVQEPWTSFFKKPWLCSMNDFEHPQKFKCKKLSHLALDYGVTVNPSDLHTALGDVRVLVQMLVKMGVDMSNVAKRSEMKAVVIRAIVPSPYGLKGDGGKGKDKAKACGFNWDGDRKFWIKEIKEDDFQREEERLGYKCSIIC